MRPSIRPLFLLATLLISLTATAQAEPPSSAEEEGAAFTTRWTYGRKKQRVSGRWYPYRGPITESKSESESDEDFYSHEEEFLSGVGPIISTRTCTDSMTPDAPHAWRSERINVTFAGGYRFDLESYLRRSKQSGDVVAQWLKQLPARDLDRSACPSRDELRFADRSLGYWLGRLEATGCLRPSAQLEFVGSQRKHFSIEAWSPDSGLVKLGIEATTCRVVATICELQTLTAWIRPPREWRPWLDAARAGDGLLGEHRLWRIAGMKDAAAIEQAQRIWSAHSATPLFIGEVTSAPEIHIAGIDDEPHGRVCFKRGAILRAPAPQEDRAGVVCLDVLSPRQLKAAGLDETSSQAEITRAFPEYGREGAPFLLHDIAWVERARVGAAAPLPRETARFLTKYFSLPTSTHQPEPREGEE